MIKGEAQRRNQKAKRKPQWFSTAVAVATNNATSIECNPFPTKLREAMEPHICKSRQRREDALQILRNTNPAIFDKIFSRFQENDISTEGEFPFDTFKYPLRESLLEAFALKNTFDLSKMHEDPQTKNKAFHSLTNQPKIRIRFHETFDNFVRKVCAPHLASLHNKSSQSSCTEIYYQAFPCIRIVQPYDFSIGPHADVMYGHHPCAVNYYLPLTSIGGTSALFLESAPNKEDWHPIVGNYGSCVKHFAGGMNLHYTVENWTGETRVSLDFRLIEGSMFESLDCKESQFVKKNGYYSKCVLTKDKNITEEKDTWERSGDLLSPDGRVGFPWTVKDWNKILKTR